MVVPPEVHFQDGGCGHHGFRKTAVIPLLFDRSLPKVVKTVGIRFGTNQLRRKCIDRQIQDGGCRHLELRRTVAIS